MSINNSSQKYQHHQPSENDLFDQFHARLPNKPYCSNDLGFGVKICSKKHAVQFRYIQNNPPTIKHWLTFDIDHEKPYVWEDAQLPVPNMVVRNPDNLKCHISYALESVCTSDAARPKPMAYVAAIQYAYTMALQADVGYAGLITKNPLHPEWHVIPNHAYIYSLGELADSVDLSSQPKYWTRKRAANDEQIGLGRNCALFHRLRYWAYDHVNDWRAGSTCDQWMQTVLQRAESMNTFTPALPYSEIKSTAKSVGKWVWTKYTGIGSGVKRGAMAEVLAASQIPLDLKTKQRLSARKTNERRKKDTEERIITAIGNLTACGHKVTQAAVARCSGINKDVISRNYRHLFYM